MNRVVVIGCGVVGAAIAYELGQLPGLEIIAIDQHLPAEGCTGAALGVLMGVISQKVKGRTWELRQTSIQRYAMLIPELETISQYKIPVNHQGILKLCTADEDLKKWQQLVEIRQSQGWQLEIWDRVKVQKICPHLNGDGVLAAIYSPQDKQLDPTALTRALVAAAKRNGVAFQFGVRVLSITHKNTSSHAICQLQTTSGFLECDRLVIAAGLGSTKLTKSLQKLVDIRPVLGQAIQYKGISLGNPDFQPVITRDDVHIVPIGDANYWVGATVEFPSAEGEVVANPDKIEEVKEKAIALCPTLAKAEIVKQWSGLRPRPEGRPAPIISYLPGYDNILLATGHYRNGVLLAPATALEIRKAIDKSLTS